MIPESNIGSLSVLNVGEGDLKLSFDSDNPEEVERAKSIIQDMMQRGYLIFVQDGDKLKRVKRFKADTCEYVIQEPPADKGAKPKEKRLPAGKSKAKAVPRTAGG